MRYCRLDEYNQIVKDVQLRTIYELIAVLIHADYMDWLEGIGQPMSHANVQMWREMGKFLNQAKGLQCQSTIQ